MSDKDRPLIATGKCSITAAKDEEGKAKLPTIEIEAYNGGIMSVGYWGPVVIDLSGLTASDSVPILYSHNTYNVNDILGQTDRVVNDGKTVSMSGTVMAGSDTAENVKTLAGNGFKFQASVGIKPQKYSFVEKGATADANGKTHKGPFTFIEASTLNEVSVVPMGADGSTSAKIAAEQEKALAASKEKEVTMSDTIKGKPVVASTEPTAESIRAAAVAEQGRIAEVNKVAKDHPEIAAKAIADEWTPEATELAVVKAQLAAETKRNERPDAPNISGFRGKEVNSNILAAAVSLRAGLKDADKSFDGDTCQKAEDLKIHSFTDLVRAGLAASGKQLDATRHETRDFLQAAFSTRDISNVLSNVANKFVNEGFGMVEQTWREVASVRPVVDFKANTGVRLVMTDLLKQLSNGGEIAHGSLSDEARTVQADTKALMIGVSRKDIINDDLGVLSDIPRKLGYASARTFNVDFWAALEAAVAANFTAGNKNTTTGALTLTTLATAEALYLALTDPDGNPLGTMASTLLCGTGSYTAAREIYASTVVTDGSTSKKPSKNIYENMFKPAFSRYLSAAPWYLISNPMGVPLMEASFLNGREEPFIETADANFGTLGVEMRAYYDYGCDFAEWRAGVRSTGA